ncbi:strictosidine synthase-like 2 [Striga asiatica]|uniref:Strictosidine synthase-like 2 n=1 Tax=Striga asiatica TaxID=4170 RepID=A0A5A7PR66_STRAF|nr:strictosidine synthase-like 2 [Striga asiatica]
MTLPMPKLPPLVPEESRSSFLPFLTHVALEKEDFLFPPPRAEAEVLFCLCSLIVKAQSKICSESVVKSEGPVEDLLRRGDRFLLRKKNEDDCLKKYFCRFAQTFINYTSKKGIKFPPYLVTEIPLELRKSIGLPTRAMNTPRSPTSSSWSESAARALKQRKFAVVSHIAIAAAVRTPVEASTAIFPADKSDSISPDIDLLKFVKWLIGW